MNQYVVKLLDKNNIVKEVESGLNKQEASELMRKYQKENQTIRWMTMVQRFENGSHVEGNEMECFDDGWRRVHHYRLDKYKKGEIGDLEPYNLT